MIPYIHVPDLSLGSFTVQPAGVGIAAVVAWAIGWARTPKADAPPSTARALITLVLVVGGFIAAYIACRLSGRFPEATLGPIALHPFGLLVATGVILGTAITTRRARSRGIDVDRLNSFITWMLVAGFIGGHMLDEIFYHPDEIMTRPILFGVKWPPGTTLLMLWTGLSSFGGFVGGMIGVFLWKYFDLAPSLHLGSLSLSWFRRREKPLPILPFCDLVLSVFPVAWIFGRSGCSAVHDHPGARASADAVLAVAYGDARMPIESWGPIDHVGPIELIHGSVPRYDLGTLELMFTIIVAACFVLTWHKKVATGAYVAVVSLAYAPVRFAMDFLRVTEGQAADPRYAGLTPAQWQCIALFAFGVYIAFLTRSLKKRGVDPMDVFLAPHSHDHDPAPVPA